MSDCRPYVRYNANAKRWETRHYDRRHHFWWFDVYEADSLEQAMCVALKLARASHT